MDIRGDSHLQRAEIYRRSDRLEALHNLTYLMRLEIKNSEILGEYLGLVEQIIRDMSDEIAAEER